MRVRPAPRLEGHSGLSSAACDQARLPTPTRVPYHFVTLRRTESNKKQIGHYIMLRFASNRVTGGSLYFARIPTVIFSVRGCYVHSSRRTLFLFCPTYLTRRGGFVFRPTGSTVASGTTTIPRRRLHF